MYYMASCATKPEYLSLGGIKTRKHYIVTQCRGFPVTSGQIFGMSPSKPCNIICKKNIYLFFCRVLVLTYN